MVQIGVCDDKRRHLDAIRDKLYSFFEGNQTDCEIDTYEDGLLLLSDAKLYDILILDIEMPKINGFDLAKQYKQRYPGCILIFLTSHVELALQGYRYDAFRYLDKHGSEKEWNEALSSALRILMSDENLVVKTIENETITLYYQNIYCIETEGRRVCVRSDKGDFLTTEKISAFHEKVPKDSFFLAHRSVLINFLHVAKWKDRDIRMKNGALVTLSGKKKSDFKQAYSNWLFLRGNG